MELGCSIPPGYIEINCSDPLTRKFKCKYGGDIIDITTPIISPTTDTPCDSNIFPSCDVQRHTLSSGAESTDFTIFNTVSIESINCDTCHTHSTESDCLLNDQTDPCESINLSDTASNEEKVTTCSENNGNGQVCSYDSTNNSCISEIDIDHSVSHGNCFWQLSNGSEVDRCIDNCQARSTKGECEQYHEWNRNKLTTKIYDFDGSDNRCQWHHHPTALDETIHSKEGDCRPKQELCFDPCSTVGDTCESGENSGKCYEFKDGNYCIPFSLDESDIGKKYCGYNYEVDHRSCPMPNMDTPGQECGNPDTSHCELYVDPRYYNFDDTTIQSSDKGICISDGLLNIDQVTGVEIGLLMTDEQCSEITSRVDCSNYNGSGCIWETFNKYCVPTINDSSHQSMIESCDEINGHVPDNYDLNMIEQEGINIAEYNDNNNKEFPYKSSAYLCDVCHIRNLDLDNMYDLSQIDTTGGQTQLDYYMLKNTINFNPETPVENTISPQQYCTTPINKGEMDEFNPCRWNNSDSYKGGTCSSVCSEFSPNQSDEIVSSRDLENLKDSCVSNQWFPENDVHSTNFPSLNIGAEDKTDYFNDRYCSWDGFECHNSIPCKFAQQTRCEDLGYDWYEGTAIDVMNQAPEDLGIALDVSAAYPIERKGDGKPVEGNMEGVCIFPNTEAGFIGQPGKYEVRGEYNGHQVIIMKWREYGTGWWEDSSLLRKMSSSSRGLLSSVLLENSSKSYFLGENVALIPFIVTPGATTDDIKNSINTALQNYKYYVFNGEWMVYALDVINSIDRSYDSSIDETLLPDERNLTYGVDYYTTLPTTDINPINRKRLNVLYDLRGTINMLPVVNDYCVLQIHTLDIDTSDGSFKMTIKTPDINNIHKSRFQFVEFIGQEIFSTTTLDIDSKLNLTVLSKYRYTPCTLTDTLTANNQFLPNTIHPSGDSGSTIYPSVPKGYGTLYENKFKTDISTLPQSSKTILHNRTGEYNIIGGNTDLDAIMNELKTSYSYTDISLQNWAVNKEYTTNNVFSQPIITVKDELDKAMCKHSSYSDGSSDSDGSSGPDGSSHLCSGSLESYKIMNLTGEDTSHIIQGAPTYQILNLQGKGSSILKLLRKYTDNTPTNRRGTGTDASDTSYLNNYQPSSMYKAALWSITRNTPDFWGNLFYHRATLGTTIGATIDDNSFSLSDLYIYNSNFNIIDGSNNPLKETFKHQRSLNTLIRPFSEDSVDTDQYILWDNMLKYIGGNKREIQLTRNVPNENYKAYIDSDLFTPTKAGRTHNGSTSGSTNPYYIAESGGYDTLKEQLLALNPIINLSKQEYLLRSVLDWTRIDDKPKHTSTQVPTANSSGEKGYPNAGWTTLRNVTGAGYTIPLKTGGTTQYPTWGEWHGSTRDDWTGLSGCKNPIDGVNITRLVNDFTSSLDETQTKITSLRTGIGEYIHDFQLGPYRDGSTYCPDPGKGYRDQGLMDTANNVRAGCTALAAQDRRNGSMDYLIGGETGRIFSNADAAAADGAFCGSHYVGRVDYNFKYSLPPNHTFAWDDSTNPPAVNDPGQRYFNNTVTASPTLDLDDLYKLSNINPKTTNTTYATAAAAFNNVAENPSDAVLAIATAAALAYTTALAALSTSATDYDSFISWGEGGMCEKDSSDPSLWSMFNDTPSSYYNFLKYSDSDTDWGVGSNNLLKWCLTTDGSIDPADQNIQMKGAINKQIDIDFNNPENHMGILYHGWMNGNYDDIGYEFFNRDKQINAWKYPHICEPWNIKSGGPDTKPTYSFNNLNWSSSTTGDQSVYSITSGEVLPDDDMVTFGEEDDRNRRKQLLMSDETISPTDSNQLYTLLHPLSITCARPLEKSIYVDITPNNHIILDCSDNTGINLNYFKDNLSSGASVTEVPQTGLESPLNRMSIVNKYDNILPTNKNYWLHPGVEGFYGYGVNGEFDEGNKYVKYFYSVYKLMTYVSSTHKFKLNRLYDGSPPAVSYNFSGDEFKTMVSATVSPKKGILNTLKTIHTSEYESGNYPMKNSNTQAIHNDFFGRGKNTDEVYNFNYDIQQPVTETTNVGIALVPPTDYCTVSPISTGTHLDFYTIPPVDMTTYYNISMVFEGQSGISINTCKELIRDKLLECGNSAIWTSTDTEGCNSCFGSTSEAHTQLCSTYTQLIEGKGGGIDATSTKNTGENLGVCGILDNKRTARVPWDYIDISIQPPGFGENMPAKTPYDMVMNDCSNVDEEDTGLDFIKLNRAGSVSQVDDLTFFKPVRNVVSDIFLHDNSDNPPFGCIREDLSLMKENYLKLSCNTNLATPVERDKHVIINYIINNSNGQLNTSDRTKMAIMSEEELLNKTIELDIPLHELNEYTRPIIQSKITDIKNKYICEDNTTPCNPDDDSACPGKCGLYEGWNDLQKYYFNIPDEDKYDYINNKQWEFIGCGLDLNYSDGSSGEFSCKDKYPGLCETNIEKCTSPNIEIKESMLLDCPETCNVQFSDLDSFSGVDQMGALSICSSRGRCKWSHDQDPSNLLPLCEEHTSRQMGSTEKCNNYNSLEHGPNSGSCNLYDYPNTLDSSQCKEQRCLSMEGCKFTQGSTSGCYSEQYTDPSITNEEECNLRDGRWVGQSALSGSCILPSYFNTEVGQNDCSIIGGNWRPSTIESCMFLPDIGYIGEDPCSHVVDLDDLSYDEQLIYFNPVSDNPIYIESIQPVYMEGDERNENPHYLQLNLTANLDIITYIDEFPNNIYIYIEGNSDTLDATCSQYLLGKSKIIQKVDNSTVIIGAPNKSYTLPIDMEKSAQEERQIIDIGEPNACSVSGLYDIENYYVNKAIGSSLSDAEDSNEKNSCIKNEALSCNYETDTTNCVSCSTYNSQEECFRPLTGSHCGWGSVKDVCETLGNIDECNKMHMDGCQWNLAQETCTLNELADDDGNPLVSKIGCIKCGDIKHNDACNSIKNCFWDRLSNIDGDGKGECRACSSLMDADDSGEADDGVGGFSGEPTPDFLASKMQKCDNYQLTGGQCQFREKDDKTSSSGSWYNIFEEFLVTEADMFTAFIGGDYYVTQPTALCENESDCECKPTRPYPLIPDWTVHNIVFLIVFTPFIIYFLYAWWMVIISNDISYNSSTPEALKPTDNLLKGIYNDEIAFDKATLLYNLFPPTGADTDKKKVYVKIAWIIVSLPFTLLQLLSQNFRLAIAHRLYYPTVEIPAFALVFGIIPSPLGFILKALLFVGYIVGILFLIKAGITIILNFMAFGIRPNHNYVDTINELSDDSKNPPPAIWWQTTFREEWNDLLRDPLNGSVLDERQEVVKNAGLLGNFFDGSVINISSISNADIHPESLDWTYYPKLVVETYNSFINRIGDEFLFNWLILTFIMYKFYIKTNTMISDYGISGNTSKLIKNLIIAYMVFSIIIIVIRSLMIHTDTDLDVYDGVEVKCYEPEYLTTIIDSDIYTPTACFGRSVIETNDDGTISTNDIDECPAGCYYTGTKDGKHGKPCRDNRSILSLHHLFEPRLNMPLGDSDVDTPPADWYQPGEGKNYVCPPYPSYRSKYPYDTICSSGQTKCSPTNESSSILSAPDEYCEIQYRLADPSTRDNKCINNNFDPISGEGPRGPIDDGGKSKYQCQLEIPDLSNDTRCPFKLATTELYDFDEMEQRSPVSIWKGLYDIITGHESISEAKHISWQNENRYLIVNQNYDKSLFS